MDTSHVYATCARAAAASAARDKSPGRRRRCRVTCRGRET